MALAADLTVPAECRGLVIFAHGSGSGRHSPRNRAVASALVAGGFATLLLDLLTDREERVDASTAELRFDVAMLGGRLVGAVDWASTHETTQSLPIGLFGASTGAAAAIIAATSRPNAVRAVVSRGGRPDLADSALDSLAAPTLLIVGSLDETVVGLNRQALTRIPGPSELKLVEGATHLFEEPGALEEVARLSGDWFRRYL